MSGYAGFRPSAENRLRRTNNFVKCIFVKNNFVKYILGQRQESVVSFISRMRSVTNEMEAVRRKKGQVSQA
jgi:hypothetical protein